MNEEGEEGEEGKGRKKGGVEEGEIIVSVLFLLVGLHPRIFCWNLGDGPTGHGGDIQRWC